MTEKDNIVYVGSKPTMSYSMAVSIMSNQQEQIIIKARGRLISKAIDVLEITKRKILKDWKYSIESGTDVDSESKNVSNITITLTR